MRVKVGLNRDRATIVIVVREIKQKMPKHAIQIPLEKIVSCETELVLELPEVLEGDIIPVYGT